jgi:hypothetical protein
VRILFSSTGPFPDDQDMMIAARPSHKSHEFHPKKPPAILMMIIVLNYHYRSGG